MVIAVITAIAAVFYIFFAGDGGTDAIKAVDSVEAVEAVGIIYALSAIAFGFLAVWVFSIGALIVLVQLIYGLVKYPTQSRIDWIEESKIIFKYR